MTEKSVKKRYFEWIKELVNDDRYVGKRSFDKLLFCLNDIQFTYTIAMDGNRASDGVDLRYRFGRDTDVSDWLVAAYLDYRPCSVLEMMAALALRCGEHIMDNPDTGSRIGQWFWGMVKNLGLYDMTDTNFDREAVSEAVERFLNREYAPDGSGGLFTVRQCRHDMRSIEIWYQAMWYLDEVLKG